MPWAMRWCAVVPGARLRRTGGVCIGVSPYRNHRKTPSFSYGDIRWCLRSGQSISSEVRGVTMKPLALAMGRSHEAFDPPEAKQIADKLDIHYTPKHGSWLNMAEIELSHLSRQCLADR